MTVDLVVATHGFTSSKRFAAEAVEFHMSDQGWRQSKMVITGAEPREIACGVLSEITGPTDVLIPTKVFGTDGALRGEWMLTGVTTQLPDGANAFLYVEDEDGFWDGVTLAYSRDRLAIHHFKIDPL
jgi:hypothetical protein